MVDQREVKRQHTHIFLGLLIVTVVKFGFLNGLHLLIISVLALTCSLLTKKGYKIPIFNFFLEEMKRKNKNNFPAKGLVFFLFGATSSIILFPEDIALASILILTFGDSVSRLLGPKGYVRHPYNNKKFIEGIIVGAFVAMLAAYFFVPLIWAFFGSYIAMFIEGLDIEINEFKLDDNFTIPLVSGSVMFLLMIIIGRII